MPPTDLTTVLMVNLLSDAYQEVQGGVPSSLTPAERAALVEYLGGHPEKKVAVLRLWQERLVWQRSDPESAASWLDNEFLSPDSLTRKEARP
ncbi:hypothetical protein [Deinococcus apachensis]|uniref:hypothetical protein n=1 Tax=Deinococcus apachensis TaxID=309886 RepID=UPI00037A5FA4|nr:hypothetical protein [Deinococcus apachensis]